MTPNELRAGTDITTTVAGERYNGVNGAGTLFITITGVASICCLEGSAVTFPHHFSLEARLADVVTSPSFVLGEPGGAGEGPGRPGAGPQERAPGTGPPNTSKTPLAVPAVVKGGQGRCAFADVLVPGKVRCRGRGAGAR